jgi:hypothetical protein
MLYLGIFVILSQAFDLRFYPGRATLPALLDEMDHAIDNFQSLLHIFSARFIILLEGQPLAHSYIFDRLLAEFAAAAVTFAKAMDQPNDECFDNEFIHHFAETVEGILHECHPGVFPYYLRCLNRHHKDFLWTGPKVEIIPRSDGVDSIIPSTTMGELLDSPIHSIYVEDIDPQPTSPLPSKDVDQVGQRRGRRDSMEVEDDHPKKRRR